MKIQHPVARQGLVPNIILAALAILMTAMATGCQAQSGTKSPVTKADYKLWSDLVPDKISEDGKWVSYILRFDDSDTTVVQSTGSRRHYKLSQASNGVFLGQLYLYQETSGQVNILDLIKGTHRSLSGSTAYHVLGTAGMAIEITGGKLAVIDSTGVAVSELEASQFHTYIAGKRMLVYSRYRSGSNSLMAHRINNNDPWELLKCSDCRFSSVVADGNGTSIAFLQHHKAQPEGEAATWIGHYNFPDKKTSYMKPDKTNGFPIGYEPTSSSFTRVGLSADGSKVFVGLLNTNKAIARENVHVWSSSDKLLSFGNGYEYNNRMGVWWPGHDRFEQLTDMRTPNMMLTGKQSHVLLYDPFQYEPQFDREGPSDIHIRELNTGVSKLLLARQYNIHGTVSVSPGGSYIAYFSNSHWHVYDITTGIHRNITENIASSFSDVENDEPGEDPPYGVAGWMASDDTILLYDRFDIWSISLKSGMPRKITDGITRGLTFRIIPQNEVQSGHANYNGPRFGGSYSSNDSIILSAAGMEIDEYHCWNPGVGTILLVSSRNQLSEILQAGNRKAYIYLEQNHNMPPQVMFKGSKSNPDVIYKSNPQHDDYQWGQRIILSYRNSKGDDLQGILYFPSGYDPARRYPMVVHVYQVQSHQANNYLRPTDYNTTGFNIASLQSQGYFVFLPDIKYVTGEPGPSALDCVLAGVSRAQGAASVDSGKIGLIGHSFGGFEAAYIISHSDVFATVLLGSAITDFSSSYFYVNPHLSNPNFWRYEYGQFRMGRSFFEDPKGYYYNSPITSAENIKVPVLIWAGLQDKQVHHFQGTGLYLALRRLGRQAVLLLYPDEGHIMRERKQQEDLTVRVEGWLDYYLKDGPKPNWLE